MEIRINSISRSAGGQAEIGGNCIANVTPYGTTNVSYYVLSDITVKCSIGDVSRTVNISGTVRTTIKGTANIYFTPPVDILAGDATGDPYIDVKVTVRATLRPYVYSSGSGSSGGSGVVPGSTSTAAADKTAAMGVANIAAVKPYLTGDVLTVGVDNSGTIVSGLNCYVYGLSVIRYSIDQTKVQARYNARIARFDMQSVSRDTVSHAYDSANNPIVGMLAAVEGTRDDEPLALIIYDSRNKTTQDEISLPAYTYAAPTISGVEIYRSDAMGNEDDNGAYIRVKAKGTHSACGGNNVLTMTASYAPSTNPGAKVTSTIASDTAALLGGGSIQSNVKYHVVIEASDTAGNKATYAADLQTADVTFNVLDGGNGVAFGHEAYLADTLDTSWDIHSDKDISADGNISGKSGSFTGGVSAGGVISTGAVTGTDGTFSGAVTGGSGSFTGGVTAAHGSFADIAVTGGFPESLKIQPGDVLTFSYGSTVNGPAIFAGNFSGASTGVYFAIPIGRPISDDVTEVTITGKITVRGVKGYITQASYSAPFVIPSSGYTAKAQVVSRAGGMVGVLLTKNSGTWGNGTNNTPITVSPSDQEGGDITITFN